MLDYAHRLDESKCTSKDETLEQNMFFPIVNGMKTFMKMEHSWFKDLDIDITQFNMVLLSGRTRPVSDSAEVCEHITLPSYLL
jgi:hypothetical protein